MAQLEKNSSSPNDPSTFEEMIDAAYMDEESGDRWHTSDFSKALRFYQSAFEWYSKAIEHSNEVSQMERIECHYNALRLLLLVYNQYTGSDCLDLSQLASVPEVLQAGSNCVLQEIDAIVAAHENAISISGNDASNDLLYNSAMVYLDVIENLENDPQATALAASKASTLFKQVFSNQVQEFQDSLNMTSQQIESPDNESVKTSAIRVTEIIETAISYLKLFRIYTDDDLDNLDLSVVEDLTSSLNEADNALTKILSAAHLSDDNNEIREHLDEYILAAEYFKNSGKDIELAIKSWESPTLPDSAERYMLAADSIQSILERQKLNTSSGGVSQPDLYWTALCKMNQYLKNAQELLQSLSQKKKSARIDQTIGLGNIILQMCSVYIARADIDLQRSLLNYPEAQKHKDLLGRNAVAFLKNALTLSKQTGGIRETALEKLQREKRRQEAQIRLFIIEGKSQTEISSSLNSILAQQEYEICSDCWYYKMIQQGQA